MLTEMDTILQNYWADKLNSYDVYLCKILYSAM